MNDKEETEQEAREEKEEIEELDWEEKVGKIEPTKYVKHFLMIGSLMILYFLKFLYQSEPNVNPKESPTPQSTEEK